MPAPLSQLAARERQQLLADLNYLNLGEIKAFCKQHAIPYRIMLETTDGQVRSSGEDDRKGVILERVRHFLETGAILPETRFPASVICFDPLPKKLSPDDRLYYGQYDKGSPEMVGLLKRLTAGKFRNGAIARIVAREFWTAGEAPTFAKYATKWLHISQNHTAPNPEWAFLTDLANKKSPTGWKELRAKKAAAALKILRNITAR